MINGEIWQLKIFLARYIFIVVPEGIQLRREGGNGLKDQACVRFIGWRLERRRRPEMQSGYANIEFKEDRRRRWRFATLQDGV